MKLRKLGQFCLGLSVTSIFVVTVLLIILNLYY